MLTFLIACAPDMWGEDPSTDVEGQLDPSASQVGELVADDHLALEHVCGAEAGSLDIGNDGTGPLVIETVQVAGDWELVEVDLPLIVEPGEVVTLELSSSGGDGLLRLTGPDVDHEVELTATVDAPPTLHLVNPADGAVVDVATTLGMEAWASDDVDDAQDLTARWTSDLDGELSFYPPLEDGLLTLDWTSSERTEGTHLVTVSVTDSCGNQVEETVSVCQTGGFAMSELAESAYLYSGHASWDDDEDCLALTAPSPYQTGSVFIRDHLVDASDTSLSFSFNAGGRDGADGLALIALDVDRMSNTLGAEGCGLGYGDPSSGCIDGGAGLPGWQLEIDTYYNEQLDESDADHMALSFDGDQQTVVLYAEIDEVEDGAWHDVTVDVVGGHMTVTLDGVTVIDEDAGVPSFDAWIGFTAATGGDVNAHMADALVVRDGSCASF